MVKNIAVFGLFTLINLLVAIILGISLDVYFGTKKTQTTNELPEDLGPQIEVSSLSAKYNPNPEESVEGYAAEGDINYTALSKSVDMTIKWYNYSGFTNITELVIKRYIGDSVKTTKTLKKSISSESKYFESYSQLLTYTFEGKNVDYSVIGMNKIKIFYKNASNQEVELTPTNLSGVQINKEDLTQTKDLLAPIDVVYQPSAGGEISVSPEITRKGYFMYPGGSNLSIQEYIVSATPHGKVYLVPSGTKNTTVKIKLENNNFIKYTSKTNTTTAAFSFNQTTGTEFTLVKGENDGTIRLKIGDTFAAVKDGKLVMLKMSDITTVALYNTLDITFTETAVQKQDCVFSWDYGEINKSTGKQIKTYNVITKSAAGGTACLYDDGKTITEDVKVNCEGGWNGYGACSKSCGPGTKTRTWNATVQPKNNGTACPSAQTISCNLKSCKTCQSNSHELGFLSAYGLSSSYSSCPGITNETSCINKEVDWSGYGYPAKVCDWK
tara:strand:- start:5 stop:1495 length:1491 start_codon:yes stop_codon:yes gene_type:complete